MLKRRGGKEGNTAEELNAQSKDDTDVVNQIKSEEQEETGKYEEELDPRIQVYN